MPYLSLTDAEMSSVVPLRVRALTENAARAPVSARLTSVPMTATVDVIVTPWVR